MNKPTQMDKTSKQEQTTHLGQRKRKEKSFKENEDK